MFRTFLYRTRYPQNPRWRTIGLDALNGWNGDSRPEADVFDGSPLLNRDKKKIMIFFKVLDKNILYL